MNNNYSSRGGMTNSRGAFRGDNRTNHYSQQNGPYPIKPSEKSNRMTSHANIAEKENRSENIGLSNHAE